MNELLQEFNKLILSITEKSSLGQKKYANSLLIRMFALFVDTENEFDRHSSKFVTILKILGLSKVEYERLNDEFIEFMLKNAIDLNRQITVNELIRFKNLYNLYIDYNNKEPKNLNDLKIIINEYNS